MNKIIELRKEIDFLDAQIITLISKRNQVVKKIGEYKKENNLKIEDKEREGKILQRLEKIAENKNKDPEIILRIYDIIFEKSKKDQNEIKQKN